MTSFILKIIGILTMASDHIGYTFLGDFSFFNYIGRIAFPLFAFQSVQGYLHTKDFKKHIKKLTIFAFISQIPFMLFLSTFTTDVFKLNVLFTFILGLLSIFIYNKIKNKKIAILYVLLFSVLAQFTNCDYGMYGVLLVFLFYFFKDNKKLMYLSVILLTIIKYVISIILYPVFIQRFILCIIFTCVSLIFINFYNKKEGPKEKYLFYIFYPAHLTILWIIHLFL